MNTDTIFSECRRYRYTLWRMLNGDRVERYSVFICLNPSTADEINDDPTIRRCIGFSKQWGMDAFCMLNLFAFRATDPVVMKREPYPVGADNDTRLIEIASGAAICIAGWGTHGAHLYRGIKVKRMLIDAGIKIHHLGLSKDGFPKHPLYLKSSTEPTIWV